MQMYPIQLNQLNLYRLLYLNNSTSLGKITLTSIEPIQIVVFKYKDVNTATLSGELNLYRLLYLNVNGIKKYATSVEIEPIQIVVFKQSELVIVVGMKEIEPIQIVVFKFMSDPLTMGSVYH